LGWNGIQDSGSILLGWLSHRLNFDIQSSPKNVPE